MKLRDFYLNVAVVIFSFFCLSASYALPWDDKVKTSIPDSTSTSSKEIRQTISSIFDLVAKSDIDRSLISEKNLKEYLSGDIQYEVNGVVAANNLSAVIKRWRKYGKAMKSYTIEFPLKSIVIANDKAVIAYQFSETRNDGTKSINLASIVMTFKQGKVSNWQSTVMHL